MEVQSPTIRRQLISLLGKSSSEFEKILGKPASRIPIKYSDGTIISNQVVWGVDPSFITGTWKKSGRHSDLMFSGFKDWRDALRQCNLEPYGIRPRPSSEKSFEGVRPVTSFILQGVQGLPEGWHAEWVLNNLSFSVEKQQLDESSDEMPFIESKAQVHPNDYELEYFDGAEAFKTVEGNAVRVDIFKEGKKDFNVNLRFNIGRLHNGRKYLLEFEAKTDKECAMTIIGQQKNKPYWETGLLRHAVPFSTSFKKYKFEFEASNCNDITVCPAKFFLGKFTGKFWIRGATLTPLDVN